MCIDHITTVFINFTNRFRSLLFRCIVAIEISQLHLHFICDMISTIFCQFFHQNFIFLRIISCDSVNQTLQIAGNQDIHRWWCCQNKLSVSVINSCSKEVKQYFIVIRRTDQFFNRQTHIFCIVSGQDISKVTGRNYYINLFTLLDLSCFIQICICIYIIHNLRNQTADIDRVCRRELITSLFQLCFHLSVVEDFLYASLRIIKVSANRNNVSIVSFLSYHLFFLNRTHTVFRIKYDNFSSRYISKTCHCCFSCIAGSCSQNYDVIGHTVFLRSCCQQIWKNRQSHVFESYCRSVE